MTTPAKGREIKDRIRTKAFMDKLRQMTPEPPNAITWERGVEILNVVQEHLYPTETTLDEHIQELMVDELVKSAMPSKCELRPGIGLCDSCGLPKFPQQWDGCGHMVCLDCWNPERKDEK